jgi:thiamine monophosphate synthase
LPLHNNAAELAARRVVRKRDISLHTWCKKGTQTRYAFMSIVEMAIKIGVNPIQYITKRIKGQQILKPLASRIQEAYKSNFTPTF